MKIKLWQSQEVEKDIQLPFFRKKTSFTKTVEYFGMIVENSVISFFVADDQIIISVVPKWVKEKEILKVYETWEPMSEHEFLEVYETTLQSLSLKPTLVNVPAVDPDDLHGVI